MVIFIAPLASIALLLMRKSNETHEIPLTTSTGPSRTSSHSPPERCHSRELSLLRLNWKERPKTSPSAGKTHFPNIPRMCGAHPSFMIFMVYPSVFSMVYPRCSGSVLHTSASWPSGPTAWRRPPPARPPAARPWRSWTATWGHRRPSAVQKGRPHQEVGVSL